MDMLVFLLIVYLLWAITSMITIGVFISNDIEFPGFNLTLIKWLIFPYAIIKWNEIKAHSDRLKGNYKDDDYPDILD